MCPVERPVAVRYTVSAIYSRLRQMKAKGEIELRILLRVLDEALFPEETV
jgi:hypothetical protein